MVALIFTPARKPTDHRVQRQVLTAATWPASIIDRPGVAAAAPIIIAGALVRPPGPREPDRADLTLRLTG